MLKLTEPTMREEKLYELHANNIAIIISAGGCAGGIEQAVELYLKTVGIQEKK
jgi:hypothetical protein